MRGPQVVSTRSVSQAQLSGWESHLSEDDKLNVRTKKSQVRTEELEVKTKAV